MPLSREQILEKNDLPRETVEIEEWGGEVLVQCLSLRALSEWQELNAGLENPMSGNGALRVMVSLIVRCVVDESGNRLFSDEDEETIARKNVKHLRMIFGTALRLSGLTPGEAKAIEGNSGAGRDGGSSIS